MADLGEMPARKLNEITECAICMSAFNDPRMLPCIHSFCFECLNRTSEADEKKPGDRMPCPLCRKDFFIPAAGVNGLPRNVFVENLLEFKTTLQIGNAIIICDICNVRNEGKTGDISKATMRCLECQDNYCDSCVKIHQFQKLCKNHQFVKIGTETAPEMKRPLSTIYCSKHTQKPLDYYCADCKKIVCVSCFVESHASHKCKDVTTDDQEHRSAIRRNSSKVSSYADKLLLLRMKEETRKTDFLKEIVDKENAIRKRNQELKDMIDDHTKLLLDQLSAIKARNLKKMETEMQEIDRWCTLLRSFEAYCTELVTQGTAIDICSSVDQLIDRAGELERGHEAFICRPRQSVEISYQATDLREILQRSNNFLGLIKEATPKFENFVFVVGSNRGSTTTKDVVKINLHRPNEISTYGHIPTKMTFKAVAAVHCNTITEIMEWRDDILKDIDLIPFSGSTPGKIIVIGKHAAPVLSGLKDEDVLIAAAEFGRGRIVACAHDGFATDFMTPGQEKSTAFATLHKNLKRWLTRDTFDTEKSIVDADQDVSKETLMSSRIVLYRGSECKINAGDLTEYVRNGGALLHCYTPWGWLQLNPGKTIFDAPYIPLVIQAGIYYTKETVFVPGGDFVVKWPSNDFVRWRKDILKDIDVLPLKNATPGKIIVIGKHAGEVLTGIKEKDVLIAAAEFGKGRIVTISHDHFAAHFTRPEQEENNAVATLHKNLKRWLTKDTFDTEKSIVDADQDVSKEALLSSKIVLYRGSGSKINADDLTEYVRNGGALLHCFTPWGWLQLNPGKTVFEAPYIPLVIQAGIYYTTECILVPKGGFVV